MIFLLIEKRYLRTGKALLSVNVDYTAQVFVL